MGNFGSGCLVNKSGLHHCMRDLCISHLRFFFYCFFFWGGIVIHIVIIKLVVGKKSKQSDFKEIGNCFIAFDLSSLLEVKYTYF